MVDRTFRAIDRHGANMEFELRAPTLAVEHEGERYYRIAYSKSLADGIYPRNKLKEVMRQHGMWTDVDETSMKEVVANLAVAQIELEQAQLKSNDERCLEVAQKMQRWRSRMWELFMIQQSVFMNSAEGVAEVVKTEAIMAACTVLKATGERYWKDYKEFVQERDENQKSTVYAKCVEVQNELLMEVRDELEEGHPETRYLKDVKSRIMDRTIEEQVEEELARRAQDALAAVEGEDDSVEAETDQAEGSDS